MSSAEFQSSTLTSDKLIKTRSYNVRYWLIAILVFLGGAYLTHIQYLATEWFTRSGCVVVMLGIWSSLGVIIHERLVIRKTEWKRNKALNKSKFRLMKDKTHTPVDTTEVDAINALHDKELSNAIHHLRLSIGLLEVSLLVSGTFIWGFGDLITLAIF